MQAASSPPHRAGAQGSGVGGDGGGGRPPRRALVAQAGVLLAVELVAHPEVAPHLQVEAAVGAGVAGRVPVAAVLDPHRLRRDGAAALLADVQLLDAGHGLADAGREPAGEGGCRAGSALVLQSLLQQAEGAGLPRGRPQLPVLLQHLVDLRILLQAPHGRLQAQAVAGVGRG